MIEMNSSYPVEADQDHANIMILYGFHGPGRKGFLFRRASYFYRPILQLSTQPGKSLYSHQRSPLSATLLGRGPDLA